MSLAKSMFNFGDLLYNWRYFSDIYDVWKTARVNHFMQKKNQRLSFLQGKYYKLVI